MNVALFRRSIAVSACRLRLTTPSTRALSFNMFDLLPDLEKLKTRRSRSLKDAVDKGMVDQGFVSGFEHLTRPLNSKGASSPPPNQEPYKYPRSTASDSSLMTDLRLRCTELDKDGNVTVRAGEFQKSDLCAQHGLLPRDLRKIDSKFVNQMPAILVRSQAILVNLLHIRALIEADRIVLFDSIAAPATHSQTILVYELQERLRSVSPVAQPFEFRALEAVLISVVGSLQSDEEVLVSLVQNLLAFLEESVDRSKLRELLQYSKRLSRFEQKVLNIRDAIDEVLEQDDDLAAMYLTQKRNGNPRAADDHEDVELMLETYLKQVEEIVNHVENVSSHVRTTEDVVNIILDSQRNSLLLLEIRLTILTVGLSTGTFLSGLFGMNLVNSLENHPDAFFVVSAIAFTAIFALTITGLRAMRNVLRKIN
ncbi:magnesium ion transporter [Coemansia sp. RSA 376]|nr:magnesium ion transporter [Coemansia sp. S155-1]KAJ2263180.1 magnesium ion transporter [Coemansia sp. RSA 376]